MPIPKKIISIPLRAIGQIERPYRMGGKCILKPLLKVNFIAENNIKDAIGFSVKDLDSWESEIRKRVDEVH